MSLTSSYLDAFVSVARTESFSKAALALNITQSALSQRVKNLEEDLGLTLFLRTPAGAQLTEQGSRLLRYCMTKDSLEKELLEELAANNSGSLSGVIRIAAYSSVLRSVVIPSLAPLLEEYPNILCEFSCSQMAELPNMLARGEVDFIVLDYRMEKSNIEIDPLGKETFVVIEGKRDLGRNDIFLDNDSDDIATEVFFRSQSRKQKKYRRSYFDDCYGIIEGVERGLGRAIMSEHLVKSKRSIKVVSGYKPYQSEVCLHYHSQPFYSQLHKAVIKTLGANTSKYL